METNIFGLIRNNDIDDIRELTLVNFANSRGLTPLHIAYHHKRTEIVRILLSKNADVNCTDINGTSPLMLACCERDNIELSTPSLLINTLGDIDGIAHNDLAPLHIACINGHVEITRLLLMNCANVDATGEWGDTPLYHACLRGRDLVTPPSLEYGADTIYKNKSGQTALDVCVERGRTKIKEYIEQSILVKGVYY